VSQVSAELANELKTLRRGRGLQTPQLTGQIGPLLRALAGITPADSATVIREKLARRLRVLAEDLPADLRQAVTTDGALQSSPGVLAEIPQLRSAA
jgi:hypothetical protein